MFEMHASISKVLVGQLSDGLQVLLDLDSVIKFAKTIKRGSGTNLRCERGLVPVQELGVPMAIQANL
jgi:hypothetical protein